MMMLQTQESTIRQYTTTREFSRPFSLKGSFCFNMHESTGGGREKMGLQTQERRIREYITTQELSRPSSLKGHFVLICMNQWVVGEREDDAPDPGEQNPAVHHHPGAQQTL
jgi:hypothetical protein